MSAGKAHRAELLTAERAVGSSRQGNVPTSLNRGGPCRQTAEPLQTGSGACTTEMVFAEAKPVPVCTGLDLRLALLR